MRSNKILLTFVLALALNSSYGQATAADPIDIQAWFTTGVDLDLPKQWKAEVEYQARLFNNLKTYNGSFYSVGIQKGFSPWLALQAEYRLAKVLKGTYNRVSLGFVLDKKIKKGKLDFRVLYQNQVQDFDDPAKEIDNDIFVRSRIRVKKDIAEKVDLIASFEPIYQLKTGIKIDSYRIQGGVKYQFTKATSLDFYYLNRPDYAKSYKRQYHVFGIAFKYQIKVD